MIALSWPTGAGADGTATLVNITSRRLNVPNATSALLRIKLKSKLKCFFFSFYQRQYYWPGANPFPGFISHHPGLCLLWVLNRLWTFITIVGKIGFLNCGEVLKGENGPLELFCQLLSIL